MEFARNYANKQIAAAEVVAALGTSVPRPANEAQARELVPLSSDEGAMVETWRELKAEHGENVTAPKVRRAVELRLRQEAQVAGRAKVAVVPEFPPGKYPVIYADPPWRVGSAWASRAVDNHYATLDLDAIKALDIPAAKDAALFLWSLASMQPEALEVIHAWGFTYRTQFVWVKEGQPGMGSYVRTQHEPLLIATRGKMPVPGTACRPSSLISAPRREHSQKPEVLYGLIERMYPDAARLELFARHTCAGWDAWGDQVPEAASSGGTQ